MSGKNDFKDKNIATEFLKFKIKKGLVEKFIELDKKIWTEMLSKYDGFISKEVWQDEEDFEVYTIIHWESYDKWKSIPEDDLAKTNNKFNQLFGEDNYEFKEIFRISKYSN